MVITSAELRISGSNGDLAQSSGITVRQGGVLTLDNSGASNGDRLGNTADITLEGGTLRITGRSATGSDLTENIGSIVLSAGANTVDLVRGNSDSFVRFSADDMSRAVGATVEFTNTGGTFGGNDSGNNPRVTFDANPTLDDGILAYAIVNGADFATVGSAGIAAYTGYNTNNQGATWTSTSNVSLNADQTLTANRTVNSLRLGSGMDVNAGGFRLTLDSGGLLSFGATSSVISNGTLTAGTAVDEIITHVSGGGLEISAVIANNGESVGLTKSGSGTLTLSGSSANTFDGDTFVNDGTLVLNKAAGVNALSGNIVVGDGRGTDVLQINADEQIADNANVLLRGSRYDGETILRFNGGSSGITETFATLTIDGYAIIDFAGGNVCDANFLYLDDLLMTAGSGLLIRNWIDFTDFLLVKNTSVNVPGLLSQIQFEGYGGTAHWVAYDDTYSRITPVPEPSTYGALLMAAGLGFFGWRRWKTRRA